jgi:uncharacterized protein (TIGR02231 family)
MAGGVRWEPLYEARAQEAKGQIELSVLATITQATGEAWNGVELALSTALTRRDATPPEPQRLYLGATPEVQEKKVLVRRDEQVSHVSSVAPTTQDARGDETETSDQGLSVQLKVPGTVDLAGDGRPARVRIETLRLPATFRHLAVPKVLPHVVREGRAVNQARYPLVPGRVDLFSSGGFIGSAALPLVARGDKLELAFGIDEQVKVRRVVVEESRKDPGFLGSTRRLTYAYRFEATSLATRPIDLHLQDHMPVSQMDDVKVVVDPKTTSGYELEKADGILTWKLPLKPQAKTEVELRFALEIPAKYDSGSL